MPSIIGLIQCSSEEVRPGESLKIEVLGPSGESYIDREDIRIDINGVAGPVQYLQFVGEGERKLRVSAMKGAIVERAEKTILVAGDPVYFKPRPDSEDQQLALLRVSQSSTNPYEVTFSLGLSPYLSARSISVKPTPLNRGFMPTQAQLSEVFGQLKPRTTLSRALLMATSSSVEKVGRSRVLVRAKHKAGARRFVTMFGEVSFSGVSSIVNQIKANDLPSFEWNFGDATGETTAGPSVTSTLGPSVTHDYTHTLDANRLIRHFHVSCRLPGQDIEITRTLTIHYAYVLCKQYGTIVPPVVSDTFAVKTVYGFGGTMRVKNPEDYPLSITHQAIVALSDDPDASESPNKFSLLGTPLILEPKSTTFVGVLVQFSQVPYTAQGFTVYYTGKNQNGMPVRFSATFDVPLSKRNEKTKWPQFQLPDWYRIVWPWEIIAGIIQDIIDNPDDPSIKLGGAVLDKRSGTLAITVPAGVDQVSHEIAAQKAYKIIQSSMLQSTMPASIKNQYSGIWYFILALLSGLLSLFSTILRFVGAPLLPYSEPPTPSPVAEGQECEPYNLSDEENQEAIDKQLACLLTEEEREELIPGRFMNARKGDIVLSPGGNGLVGCLLREVSPPQQYSHCGIMTRNYDEITHSTASESRLVDYKVGVDGSDGLRPDALKYLWPGVVRQSIDGALHGEDWADPESGKTYSISSFSPHAVGATHNDVFEIVQPLVVKPDPMLEMENPEIRKKLHAVAASAREVGARPGQPAKAHYRLYCYSDPTIGLSTLGGAEAGWAQGTFPTVCSSFIWMMLKQHNIHLESDMAYVLPTDLESTDIEQGGEVRPGTFDGLYSYTTEDRIAAAEWLYNKIYYDVYDKAGWLGNFLTDAADDCGNQITNAFANDDADGKDSEAWKSISNANANAVSPDNIMFWDSPQKNGLYGFVEPLVYREPRTEKYKVSRWQKVLMRGTINGHVWLNGVPVEGARVELGTDIWTLTNKDGYYELRDVPVGYYELRAGKDIDSVYYSARQFIHLETALLTVEVELTPPAEHYRLVKIFYEFHGVDDEWAADDETCSPGPEYRELELGPDRVTNSFKPGDYKWGGECRAEFEIMVSLLIDNSVQVNVRGWLFEGTYEDTDDLDGQNVMYLNVPRDKSKYDILKMTNTDEGGDTAELSITVSNVRNIV